MRLYTLMFTALLVPLLVFASASEQLAVAPSVQDNLMGRVLNLLSDNVLTIIGILLVCMIAAIALVSCINSVRGDDSDFPPEIQKKRAAQSKAFGHLIGFVFGAGGVYGYLTGGFAAKAFLALMLASIAGGGTPYMYDFMWWIRETAAPSVGRWFLAKLKSMFTSNDPPPPSS
jgi:hypothetical protein